MERIDEAERAVATIEAALADPTLYVNGDDIRFLQNLETSLKEGDNISIVPAIAGG